MAYTIPADVHFNHVNDEVVILDARADVYLALNQTAAAIWDALAEGLGPVPIAARLVARFEIDDRRAAADVAACIDDLLARGLIATV